MSASAGHSMHSSERTALFGVFAGLADTLITVGAMIAASSSVLLADSLKTLLEFLAVLFSYLALRRIRRGGGNVYEYGLDKLENLSSLFIALLMFGCLAVIVINAIMNMLHPAHITGAGIYVSMVAQVVYAVINGFLFAKNNRQARQENSPVFQSQARLFLTKTIANVMILISLSASMLLAGYAWSAGWSQYIDPVASLLIAASILVPAVGVFSSSAYDLLDRTAEESHKIIILRELSPFLATCMGVQDIRTRRAGKITFVELVLEFDCDQTISEVMPTVEQLRINIEKSVPSSRVTIALSDPALRAQLLTTQPA